MNTEPMLDFVFYFTFVRILRLGVPVAQGSLELVM